MPLLKRPIEPSSITRTKEGQIPSSIRNELEYIANSTQANLIRQLSSLSQHAEDMFRELFTEASAIYERTCKMSLKVDRLKESVRMFDPNKVDIKLTDISKTKPYKSEYQTDQQICDRDTMPISLQHMYNQCGRTPRLDKFDTFRDDNESSIKMYTDPTYFRQLWFESIQKNMAENKQHRNKVKKRPSKKSKSRELGQVVDRTEKYKKMQLGKEFVPAESKNANNTNHQQGLISPSGSSDKSYEDMHHQQNMPPPPPVPSQPTKTREYQDMVYDSIPLEQQLRMQQQQPDMSHYSQHYPMNDHNRISQSPSINSRMSIAPPPPPVAQYSPPNDHHHFDIVPPPPETGPEIGDIRPVSPPPPLIHSPYVPPPQASPGMPAPPPPPLNSNASPGPPPPAMGNIPPPPPPPPPPPGAGSLAPPPPPAPASSLSAASAPSANLLSAAAASLRKPTEVAKPKDERSELLGQIRLGIKLKESEKNTMSTKGQTLDRKAMIGGAFDVQSIMDKVQAIRTAMENSDDSGSDESGSEWDSE